MDRRRDGDGSGHGPVVTILGLQGVLGGTTILAILSAIMLSALGVIVTD